MRISIKIILLLGTLFSLFSCRSKDVSDEEKPLVDSKYKLSEDRSALEELRKDIPQAQRVENDEMAYILGLMSQPQKNPSEIREKFNVALRKKRDLFQKDMKKKREEFVKKEKQEKDEFMKDIEQDRKDFNRRKNTSDQRREFYSENEAKRKNFFAEQREKRESFESDIRGQRKDFEDYAREKSNEFNQEHRAYIKRYDQLKKEKEEDRKQKKSNFNIPGEENASHESLTNKDIEKIFQERRKQPADNLIPGK